MPTLFDHESVSEMIGEFYAQGPKEQVIADFDRLSVCRLLSIGNGRCLPARARIPEVTS